VLPSGESFCNNGKKNTTLHALVSHSHHACVCHLERRHIFHTTLLEATIPNAQFTPCQCFKKEHKQKPIINEIGVVQVRRSVSPHVIYLDTIHHNYGCQEFLKGLSQYNQ